MSSEQPRFQEPGWFTRKVFNPVVAWLSRRGLSLAGSRVLEVQGRKSGEWRRTPVNPLPFEGGRYLVAPRGHTQWVKNLRAGGHGRLVGRGREEFTATELADAEKPALLLDLPPSGQSSPSALTSTASTRSPGCCCSAPPSSSPGSRAGRCSTRSMPPRP